MGIGAPDICGIVVLVVLVDCPGETVSSESTAKPRDLQRGHELHFCSFPLIPANCSGSQKEV